MHEVGVAKEVLSICLEKAKGKRIRAIKVELGNDGHTTAQSLTHAFEMVAVNTIAAAVTAPMRARSNSNAKKQL